VRVIYKFPRNGVELVPTMNSPPGAIKMSLVVIWRFFTLEMSTRNLPEMINYSATIWRFSSSMTMTQSQGIKKIPFAFLW